MTLAIVVFAALLSAQALFSLRMNLHTWNDPQAREQTRGPDVFAAPELRFTVLLPARHESAVIADTIRRIAASRYPSHLLEIVVICHEDDASTIHAARSTVDASAVEVRIETFSGTPVNKPRGLNVGLERSSGTVVCVFDAEDDVHPDLFDVVNTVMTTEQVGVVQAGVQLMNHADRWFSVHNCLEYFYWFRSRLHFHAGLGAIPLGGNTVFITRALLERVGGWDERCLTEDADIGIRLSVLGEPVRVVYRPEWVTREEAPESVRALVRQRTRWHQGFIQVLLKGDWLRLPLLRQRALALITLCGPILEAGLLLALPLIILVSLTTRIPTAIALLAAVPLYTVLLQIVAATIATAVFSRELRLGIPLRTILRLPLTYLPYQFVLGVAALRAVGRQVLGHRNWEKTEHVGAHRPPVGVPVPIPVGLRDAA